MGTTNWTKTPTFDIKSITKPIADYTTDNDLLGVAIRHHANVFARDVAKQIIARNKKPILPGVEWVVVEHIDRDTYEYNYRYILNNIMIIKSINFDGHSGSIRLSYLYGRFHKSVSIPLTVVDRMTILSPDLVVTPSEPSAITGLEE